jgi:hypothetical protein
MVRLTLVADCQGFFSSEVGEEKNHDILGFVGTIVVHKTSTDPLANIRQVKFNAPLPWRDEFQRTRYL